MDNTKFSIVIPTYNTDAVLMECLKALCNQSADKNCFEVIVVNDGGRPEIAQKLDFLRRQLSLRYFYQNNKGPAAARNLGIKKAKGEIVLFLDDDSLPTLDWLEAVTRSWEKFPGCDGIGGYVASQPKDTIFCRVNADFFNWYLEQCSVNGNYPFLATCNAGYKKAILEKVGNFDESFKRAAGEDRDLNIKISKAGGKLRLDPTILVYHDRDLTTYSFIKKHYNYGKAACNVYNRHPKLTRLPLNSYLSLYRSTLDKYQSYKEKTAAFLLLTISQIVTFIGYHSASYKKAAQG